MVMSPKLVLFLWSIVIASCLVTWVRDLLAAIPIYIVLKHYYDSEHQL